MAEIIQFPLRRAEPDDDEALDIDLITAVDVDDETVRGEGLVPRIFQDVNGRMTLIGDRDVVAANGEATFTMRFQRDRRDPPVAMAFAVTGAVAGAVATGAAGVTDTGAGASGAETTSVRSSGTSIERPARP